MTAKQIRRPEKALSARFVETAAVPGKYFDGQGLFLRVGKNGAKQWVQRITIRGKRRELGLGSPPSVSLATARRLALENRGCAMLGGDPLAEKHAARDAMTFAEAVDDYLDAKLTEFKNAKHRQQWRNSLVTYALPRLGAQRIEDIGLQDVLSVLSPIWETKTETASRLRGRIENVLSWATVHGHRSGDNPARWKGNLSELLPKPNKLKRKRHHPSVAQSDIIGWWADLAERDGIAAYALRFQVLTAARSGEVRGATWDEIDLVTDATNPTWSLGADRMKNRRPHRVPLSPQAVALLEDLPRLNSSDLLFPSAGGKQLSDATLNAVMKRIHAARLQQDQRGYVDADSKRPAVPHGLRSTFRVWATDRGYDHRMAEIALAHWQGDETERAYQRSDMLQRRRVMMEDWAGFLAGAAASSGNVVRLG